MEKLYEVNIGESIHYFVRCTYAELTDWLAATGERTVKITVMEIHLVDFNEITHNHFC